MADISRTVEILFKGTDDVSGTLADIDAKFSKAFSMSDKDLDFYKTVKSLEAVGSAAANTSSSVLSMVAGVTALNAAFNALVAGGIALAVTKAGMFSDSVNTINTLLDITDDQFSEYKAAILDYSETSVLSLQDIELSLYNLISLGVDYKDSLIALNTIEQLAVGTKSTLNQATETLIGTMNAYGASMDEAEDYSDTFFTIIKDGKTTLPELSTSIAEVTGIAAAAGIPFETLGAAIAAMTASGAPTAQAMTKIKAAIEGIINPTDSAKKAAAELGIDLSATALEAKGFEVVLKEVYDATGGNIAAIAELFTSTEALQGVLALGADEAGIFAKALKDMENNAGATDAAFAKMNDNLALVWQNMLNNFGAVVIKLGSEWEDSSKQLIAAVTATFQSLGTSIDEGVFDDLIKLVDDVILEITANIDEIAKNLPDALAGVDFTDYINSIQAIGDALGASFSGLDLTSVEGIEAAIQSVIDVMSTMNEVTASVITAMQFVVDVMTELIDPSTKSSAAVEGLSEGLRLLGDAIKFVSENLSFFIALLGAGKLIGALGTATTAYYNFYSIIHSSSGGVEKWSKIISVAGTAWASLGAAMAGWKIGTLLRDSFPAIDDFTQKLIGLIDETYRFLGLPKADFIFGSSLAGAGDEVDVATKAIKGLLDQINALPTSVSTVEIFAAVEAGDLEKAQTMIDELTAEVHESKVKAIADQKELDDYLADLSSLPPEVQTALLVAVNKGDFDEVEKILTDFESGDLSVNIAAEVDNASLTTATETLEYWVDGKRFTIEVPIETDADAANAELDKIPTEKQLEIKLQGDIDKEIALIEANAATLQSSFEWNAKLEIADVQAQAAIVETTFNSINTSIESTADLIGTALGTLNDPQNFQAKWEAQDILREEARLREQTFELQKKMTESQIRYNDAKTKALQSGGAEITIDSSGLEPALEMVMWEILKKVQVRANENASDFLLGL